MLWTTWGFVLEGHSKKRLIRFLFSKAFLPIKGNCLLTMKKKKVLRKKIFEGFAHTKKCINQIDLLAKALLSKFLWKWGSVNSKKRAFLFKFYTIEQGYFSKGSISLIKFWGLSIEVYFWNSFLEKFIVWENSFLKEYISYFGSLKGNSETW